MGSILDRIVSEARVPDLLEVLAERLSPTDLQTLMLAVYEKRSSDRTPAQVVAEYERSRFFGASPFPRSAFAAWERASDDATMGHFDVVTLSPMAPLASCASVAPVGQDWSVPTARSGEVVSDPTNILALEAALRRKRQSEPIHLATTQRVIRPQAYGNPKMLAHFALFALLSTGRDTGNYGAEAQAIGLHLDTHLSIFRALLGNAPRFSASYTVDAATADDARVGAFTSAGAAHNVPVWEEVDRPAVRGYYAGFCFHIWIEDVGGRQQLSDGGTVDWVGKLATNGKERTLVSGCGVEGALSHTHQRDGSD